MSKHSNVGFTEHKCENIDELETAQVMGFDKDNIKIIIDESKVHYKVEMRIFEEK